MPGVIPSTTWFVALVCIGAGGPSTEPTLVEVVQVRYSFPLSVLGADEGPDWKKTNIFPS